MTEPVDLGPTGGVVWSRPEEWARRRTPQGCVICQSGAPLDVIAELPSAWVTAAREAPLPHYVCVVSRRHVNEPFELTPAEQSRFWLDAMAVAAAVDALAQPIKMNYEVHGNTLPHLHLHLFPRTVDDPYVGGPVDPRRASFVRTDEQLAALAAAVAPIGRAAPAPGTDDHRDADRVNPAYDDPAMAEAFEEFAADNAYNAHYDRPAVFELLGEVRGLHVLDAACGPGLYAAELLARGAEVVGFDRSEAMLERARRRVGERATLLRADLGEQLPFEPGSFDAIVCALAIHYAPDRPAVFREFHRLLRPGGHVVVSTTHPAVDWMRKGGSYFDVRLETDVFLLGDQGAWETRFWREPLQSLTDAATSAGFTIDRLVEPRPTETMAERWPARHEKLSRQPDFLLLRLGKR